MWTSCWGRALLRRKSARAGQLGDGSMGRLSPLAIPLMLLLVPSAHATADLGSNRLRADLPETLTLGEPGGVSRSATQRFLQLISGADAASDYWNVSPRVYERRAAVRVVGVPMLLLPVEVPEVGLFDASYGSENSVRPYRRRTVTRNEDTEDGNQASRRGWPRRPSQTEESADVYLDPYLEGGPRLPAHREPPYDPVAASAGIREPQVNVVESSQKLVEQFRSQTPNAPGLPAIAQSEFDSSERVILPYDDDDDDEGEPEAAAGGRRSRAAALGPLAAQARASPARPRFARPLRLRAMLTVPRADYSETYTAWWDPASGDSRVHYNDGSTVTFRKILPDGRVKKFEVHADRTARTAVRRCSVATAAASSADRLHPALPDMQLFAFAGYEESEGGRAERWQYRAQGRSGEGGAARGEALVHLHELLLLRDSEESALPLRYTVSVNSSVLGADCDGYQHLYLDARYHRRSPAFYEPDSDVCDEVRQLDASEPEELARLEPLREFTLPQRDLRYDGLLERFKKHHERQYKDDVEEAVRKNLLMQSSRFVESGNRAGATFQLGLNFVGDRLAAEVRSLGAGVAPGAERSAAEPFPHSRASLERRLPDSFDWRDMGGVSHVRFQGMSCASCWAFAVAGAVEGALFRRTRRLTPLSEQQLVDCAHPFGGRGCKGTWPSHAYDYVRERGLAALEGYTPYKEKVESCKEETVPPVTHISGHVNVTKYSVPALKMAIRQHGPAVVIIDTTPKSFSLYKKGVLYDERCSKKSSRHAVLAVGWGHSKGEPYFILKNSWSDKWGEAGYVRVQARANTCGVLTHPSYPRLEDDDVLLA